MYESQCKGCDPGQYCPNYGMIAPQGNCSARYYCSANATVAVPTDGTTGNVCPANYYCPIGSGSPVPCEPGTYTQTTLNEVCLPCTAGYYCSSGAAPISCPAGFYCPEGTGLVWQSCPAGTFSSATGLSNVTQCTQCTGGFYCDTQNLTAVSGPCDAGYFCRSGSDSQQPSGLLVGDAGPCPAGSYCLQQTSEPTPCPSGSFNNQTKLTLESQCQDCSPGYYCETPGLTVPTGQCNAGFYCILSSNASSPSTTDATGGPCPAGSYCPTGSSLPIPCAAGKYTDNEQQSSCLTCPAGYYCEVGSPNITECPTGIVFTDSLHIW